MPSLILLRHGNTFEKGQTPTYVGGKTDMPLTSEGKGQAKAIARAVLDNFMPLSGIIAGPLSRTRQMAEMIAAETNSLFVIDERLSEIDYGLWENLSGAEIRAKFGDEKIDAWEKNGLWPDGMNWAPSQEKLERNVKALLDEMHKKLATPETHNRIIVTSNGILRFIFKAITDKAPDAAAKVATGAYCVLAPHPEGWNIELWNQKP